MVMGRVLVDVAKGPGGLSTSLPRSIVWPDLARIFAVKTYNVLEAKSNLSRLIAAVEGGREREIIIARNGRPVARLAPLSPAGAGRRFGVAKGLFEVPDDIDTVNDAVARLFGVSD
jgi:antitoxin (DNA-binding transcriptional repressor) of toxin-antitoxin stability system